MSPHRSIGVCNLCNTVEVVRFHLITASRVGWRGLLFMCACVLTERACRVLHTCLNEGHHILGTPAGIYYWNNTFLCLLYVLHCFWFVTIVRMLVRFVVVGQVTTALRSSLWLCCLPRSVSDPRASRRVGSLVVSVSIVTCSASARACYTAQDTHTNSTHQLRLIPSSLFSFVLLLRYL